MRQEFVECKTRKTAISRCPWASFIVKCEGGYKAFESLTDYLLYIDRKKPSIIHCVSKTIFEGVNYGIS